MPTPFICVTCGVQYEPSDFPPEQCPICEDDRQYVPPNGQQWCTLNEVQIADENRVALVAERLHAVYTTPKWAIGQRAHLLQNEGGNLLWDCITLIDEATERAIRELGGIRAIALSHPHYFSTIVEWSQRFGEVPIYVHEDDAAWLGRRSGAIRLWKGERLPLWNGLTLVRCGGHFPGAAVLHDAQGEGRLLVGDTIQVAPTLNTVSFMYSYPNMIPLPKREILRIAASVEDLPFDSMYGAFGMYIRQNAKEAMARSVKRYLEVFE